MIRQIYLEVEENENCEYMPLQLYEGHAVPVPITRVRMQDFLHPEAVYDVTGWDSGGDLDGRGAPVPAMYVPVSDSGQARAYSCTGATSAYASGGPIRSANGRLTTLTSGANLT